MIANRWRCDLKKSKLFSKYCRPNSTRSNSTSRIENTRLWSYHWLFPSRPLTEEQNSSIKSSSTPSKGLIRRGVVQTRRFHHESKEEDDYGTKPTVTQELFFSIPKRFSRKERCTNGGDSTTMGDGRERDWEGIKVSPEDWQRRLLVEGGEATGARQSCRRAREEEERKKKEEGRRNGKRWRRARKETRNGMRDDQIEKERKNEWNKMGIKLKKSASSQKSFFMKPLTKTTFTNDSKASVPEWLRGLI